jgi:cytochrome c oxidase accessory protein FixG
MIKNDVNKSRIMSAAEADLTFRDSIATVNEKGNRLWVYPKKPSGRFHRSRIIVSIFLISILFAGPFIKIEDQPFMLLNFFERRFVIFGQAFWPQDFFLLAIVLITFFVFVILFTVVFGRVWCGWLCPQTLFMEMVFRKIEYWIEGDWHAQQRLDKASWTVNKLYKKTLKQIIFLTISFLISLIVVAYIIGADNTLTVLFSPFQNITAFMSAMGFTGVFYFVFAKFREQACIAVCPYGRLQGVLLTKESIVVAYDWLRGEPRGHKAKSAAAVKSGHCVDCKLCLHVCPTGIDIRNGTQLECINCTACIDACDEVMLKIGRPQGLIRFASHNSISNSISKLITPRVIGYSIVMAILIGVLSFAFVTRSDVETTILKVSGTLYQRSGMFITNLYNVEFVNKTFDEIVLDIKVESPAGAEITRVDGKSITVAPENFVKALYFIRIPQKEVTNIRTIVTLGVYHDGKKIEIVKAKFIGPVRRASDAKRN